MEKLITFGILFIVSMFSSVFGTKVVTDDVGELINIITQIIVILYATITLLREKPIKWGEVIKNLLQVLSKLLAVIKIVKKKKKEND